MSGEVSCLDPEFFDLNGTSLTEDNEKVKLS
jgi:hypothetical protein